MRMRTLALPLAAGLATVVVAAGAPAQAATTGSTPVTFEVTGGALSITVPVGPVDLGSVPVSVTPQDVSAQLGNVTVTDARGGTAGWTVTAGGVDFIGPSSTVSVSAPGSSSYNPGPINTTGNVVATGTILTPIYPPGTVVQGNLVSGVNTATWNPTITVTVPGNTLVGQYTSTITHSVN
ncbi:MAG TPA: hypothetical protein VGX23_18080 [Actinocrinis sp.]|nr:hypothetical protein [Actinocrinis sp.]